MTKIFFTNFRIFLEIWSKFIFENCPSYEKTNKIICIKNEDFFLARNRFFWISYLRKANELSTTIVVLPGSAAAHPNYTYCVFWFRDFFDNFLGLIKNKLYLKNNLQLFNPISACFRNICWSYKNMASMYDEHDLLCPCRWKYYNPIFNPQPKRKAKTRTQQLWIFRIFQNRLIISEPRKTTCELTDTCSIHKVSSINLKKIYVQ